MKINSGQIRKDIDSALGAIDESITIKSPAYTENDRGEKIRNPSSDSATTLQAFIYIVSHSDVEVEEGKLVDGDAVAYLRPKNSGKISRGDYVEDSDDRKYKVMETVKEHDASGNMIYCQANLSYLTDQNIY